MQRFRPVDHNRLQMKEDSNHYDDRQRHSGSPPVYFENHYLPFRSPSPRGRPYSHNNVPMSPPHSRELSPPLRDRLSHPNDRSRRRRSPLPRRDRSRERRRRSPRRRTPPPSRSPIKRRGQFILLNVCTFF